MSQAIETFTQSIRDAENLLMHFNSLNTKPPPEEIEVLKRAGLIMAMTAWETYVEDLLQEVTANRLDGLPDQSIVKFVTDKLDDEIKRLHNPDYHKTVQLFRDYTGIDLTEHWSWNNYGPKTVKTKLGQYMKLRGDIVHRSRTIFPGTPPQPHPVKKVDLEKAINFLKCLVEATEKAVA